VSQKIKVESLNFDYHLIRTTSGTLKEFARDFVRGSVKVTRHTALSNVSFSLESSRILGVVGGNGAGKSTLLKVLAGVIPPSSGTIDIDGDVAPMIELGAGFHPEQTARENVVFFSVLLGRDLKESKSKVEEIARWAGLEDQIEFPLRAFSSGMIARLAFATATQERSDIILIDEVLSVGDERFRQATRKRIREFVAMGSSAIIVSHDQQLILEMCDEVIWLEKGSVKMFGPTQEVMAKYGQFEISE
jgi:ABC-2 type transport system ATP-binding protein